MNVLHDSISTRLRRLMSRLGPVILIVSMTAAATATAAGLDTAVNVDIEAQRLDAALVQFGVQAHVQLVVVGNAAARARVSELKGNYTVREALNRLLKGTDLRFVQSGNTIRILSKSAGAASSRRGISTREKTSPDRDPPAHEPQMNPKSRRKAAQAGLASSVGGEELQTITVTGTHIAGVPPSSSVIKISREDIDRSGYTTVGDLIRSLPENFGNAGPQTIIGSAPNANESPSGASAPNLLGLGPESTLTLVNGQRLAVDSVTGAVDISLIPLPVIDHMDVLTGGASAIYGSDAVAGVVNIVLRKDFNGARTTLLGGGTSDGGGSERYFNQMLGRRWGTGGVLLDYEFDRQDPVGAGQRSNTRSAVSLDTPLPGTSRSSFFASAHQDIGPLSAFANGLYTYRILRDAYSNGAAYPSETEEVNVHQYAASGGFDSSLPSGWEISVLGNFSEQRSAQRFALVPSGPTPVPILSYEGQTRSAEGTANGPVLELPSGLVRVAAGLGYRWETYNQEQGSSSIMPGTRAREIRYAYGELDVPLLHPSGANWRRSLVFDASGRFERYSDFGSESVPKLGLVYAPFKMLKVRGTWGRSFRAPTLYEMYSLNGLLYTPLPDRSSPKGVSDALLTLGGNRGLNPETASTWTIGLEYDSASVQGLSASASYFSIDYRGRIGKLANSFTALTDPLNAPFVTRSPSPGEVQRLIDEADFVVNRTGIPLEAATVETIVNDGEINVSSEEVAGVDIGVKYRRDLLIGAVNPFIDCTLIDLRQKLVPGAEEVEISGRVFEPAKIRARGGVSWQGGPWDLTGIVNYTGPEVNTYQANLPHVASWTTIDLNLTFRPKEFKALGGLGVTLSVENALNRDPPFVQFDQFVPGIHYDALNANVLGRVIRAGASWTFE